MRRSGSVVARRAFRGKRVTRAILLDAASELTVLKSDKEAIFTAASKAQQAAEYLPSVAGERARRGRPNARMCRDITTLRLPQVRAKAVRLSLLRVLYLHNCGELCQIAGRRRINEQRGIRV